MVISYNLSMMLRMQMTGDEEQLAERDERNHEGQGNAREGEDGGTDDSETERSERPEADEGERDRLLS